MTEPVLRLAPGVDLPLDTVTHTLAIMAAKGAGKSYTALKLAEEMMRVGAQVVLIDPTDAHYGLASSADGKGPGFPIFVFGDRRSGHADIHLEPGSGALIADVVVDEGVNVIASIRHLSIRQQREWVRDFADRLYERKGEPKHRTPLHLVIDECAEFIPQKGSSVAYEAVDRLVRMGRHSGIGITVISQRPQMVDKDVLSQCGTLIALQMGYALDRKALEAWIVAHDVEDQRDTFMASLASLPIGTAWVWSPQFLGLFKKAKIGKRVTFDSSATPKVGQTVIVPKARAEVDLAALGERMAATIRRTEEADPVRLRNRVAALERELADAVALAEAGSSDPEVELLAAERSALATEVAALTTDRGRWRDLARAVIANVDPARLDGIAATLTNEAEKIRAFLADSRGLADEWDGQSLADLTATPPYQPGFPRRPPPERPKEPPRPPSRPVPPPPRPPTLERRSAALDRGPAPSSSDAPPTELSDLAIAVLGVLCQHPDGLTPVQVGIMIGRKPRGGHWNAMVAGLRRDALISTTSPWTLTDAGYAAIEGRVRPLPRGPELLDYWCGKLSDIEAGMLRQIVRAGPGGTTADAVADALDRAPRGGHWNAAIAKLRNLQFVSGWTVTPDFAAAIS